MIERACMVCTTPFQVICCINIVNNQKIDADLYIINRFANSDIIADEIRKAGLFNAVFHINSDLYLTEYGHNHVRQRIALLSTYRKIEQIGESILGASIYSRVYVSNNAVICRIIYMYLIRKFHARLFFFDDGIGTYYDHTTTEASKIERMYRTILVSKSLADIEADYLLFHPELFIKKHSYIDRNRVKQISALKLDKEYQELIKSVFSMGNSISFHENIVILDTLRKVEFDCEGVKIFGELLHDICRQFDGEYIFKPHPKNKEVDLTGINTFSNRATPLECYCFFADISDKVLVTNASFSAFTPKLLFDQEPTIIFSYNIMEKHFYNKDADIKEAIFDLREMYRDKNKVCLPNSVSELYEIIEKSRRNHLG